jgi:hypothetical protein
MDAGELPAGGWHAAAAAWCQRPASGRCSWVTCSRWILASWATRAFGRRPLMEAGGARGWIQLAGGHPDGSS